MEKQTFTKNTVLQTVIGIFLLFAVTVSCSDNGVSSEPKTLSISPDSGSIGTQVIITGGNFVPNPDDITVYFNDTPSPVSKVNPERIVTKVPVGATSGPVVVEINDIEKKDRTTKMVGPAFLVLNNGNKGEELSIDEISPDSGVSGDSVAITGSGFSPNLSQNTVRFNGTLAEVTSVNTANSSNGNDQLTAIVPENATTGPIQVTVAEKTATGPAFTINNNDGGENAPAISGVDPEMGPVGTSVTITGTNFSAIDDENTVEFGSADATVTSASVTEIVAVVPNGLNPGDVVPVIVTVGGQSAAGSIFTVTDGSGDDGGDDAPTVNSISPTSGPIGTSVTLKGSNLKDGTVKVGTKQATVATNNDNKLIFDVPSGISAGSKYDVTVTKNGDTTTTPDQFMVTDGGNGDNDAPTIGKVDPDSGSVGIEITITGNNFNSTASENTVTFNGTEATINSATTTKLIVIVPDGATTGPIVITVGGQTTTGPTFTVENDGGDDTPPMVDTIAPENGPVGTEVTITGEGFSPTASENMVTFNGTEATLNSATTTQLVAVVPDGATTGPVEVQVNGQTANGATFTVLTPTPVIDAIDPISGPVSTVVTITGNNFSRVISENTASFNGTEATINSATTTELVVIVPNGATTGPVEVSTNGQTDTGPTFTVIADDANPEFPITGSNASVKSGIRGVCVGCGVSDDNNVIDSNLNNFAQVELGVGVTGTGFVSVESAGNIPSGGQAGFVIVRQGELIGADVLDQITIKTFLDGTEQESKSGSDVLNLDLVSGSSEQQFINFKTSNEFDEIEIEFGGLASVSNTFEVYAAYGGQMAETVPGPAINNVTPLRGPEGTEITITGNNFSATASENTVTFDGTNATITSASETELVVKVPSGATSGPVEVTVNSQTAIGPDFTVGSLPLTGAGLTADAETGGICLGGCDASDANNVIDSDPDNFATIKLVVGVGASGTLTVESTDNLQSGGQAGFVVRRNSGIIDAGLLDNITVTTFLDGTEQESKSGSGLLMLELLNGTSSDPMFIGFKTTKDFDEIHIQLGGLISADIEYRIFSVFDDFFIKE